MKTFNVILRKAKIIRYTCLFIGIIIISITSYNLTKNLDLIDQESIGTVKEQKHKDFALEVNKPLFEGYNNSNHPYQIRAQNINKKDEIFYLENVQGEYQIGQKKKILFFSKNGNFNDSSKDLYLKDHVKILYEKIEFNGSNININVKNKSIASQNQITIISDEYHIKANSLSLPANSNVLELNGGVVTIINLKKL